MDIKMDTKTFELIPACAVCNVKPEERICVNSEGRGGEGCPTLYSLEALQEANNEYRSPEIREFARQASIQEASCYANRHEQPYILQPTKTRIEEICEFADRMGYRHLGLAFCAGLAREARIVEKIFQAHGFDMVSVVCKAGGTPKADLDIKPKDTIRLTNRESMCNPIFQAQVLNKSQTDFNVLLGLCVGHDSMFFKYAEAPTTVLAVKDRVTGHNPLAAVYLSGSYYRKIRHSSE